MTVINFSLVLNLLQKQKAEEQVGSPCFVKEILVRLLSLVGQAVLTTTSSFVATMVDDPIAISHSCKVHCDTNTISLASLSEMRLGNSVKYTVSN